MSHKIVVDRYCIRCLEQAFIPIVENPCFVADRVSAKPLALLERVDSQPNSHY